MDRQLAHAGLAQNRVNDEEQTDCLKSGFLTQ